MQKNDPMKNVYAPLVFARNLAAKRGVEDGTASSRLEGRAFAKIFSETPGLLNSSFRAADVDLIFAKVRKGSFY